MIDKEILQLNIGNMPKAGRDEINRILELNEGILMADNGAAVAKVITIDIVVCANCKYAVRTKDGKLNPNDIVCSMWGTDGLRAGDYCSRGEEGTYIYDKNCIQDLEGYV